MLSFSKDSKEKLKRVKEIFEEWICPVGNNSLKAGFCLCDWMNGEKNNSIAKALSELGTRH